MPASIEVKDVSKRYSRNANSHLSYGMTDFLDEMLGRRRRLELRKDEFWAVRNASFSVEQGDSIALVGRNGSGKTTLLKMMNGLIKPDTGRITMRGRIQAIINLQAGFNPSLSGRQNILSAAALQGLGRRQTVAIQDEVIAFSELEHFIDSPVGTYSSGMKARLGFAVAVMLEPEILLIDEVLAVGDTAFRNKCFLRMEELKRSGATIVFVSHTEAQIVKLCRHAVWLHQGNIMQIGGSKSVVRSYLRYLEEHETKTIAAPEEGEAAQKGRNSLYGPVYDEDDKVDQISLQMLVNGQETKEIPVHAEVVIRFSFRLKVAVTKLYSTLNFHRRDGLKIAAIASMQDDRFEGIHGGKVSCEIRIPDFSLVPGGYVIMMPVADGQSYLWRGLVQEFVVTGGGSMYFGLMDLKHTYKVETS